jgi:hypothetical protein
MPDATQNLVLTLQTLYWVPPQPGFGPGQPNFELLGPGLWAAFFKIDGTTAQVLGDPDLGKLAGTATVEGPGGVDHIGVLTKDSSVLIPPEIGQWTTQIVPIPAPDPIGPNTGGVFGAAVLALDVTEIPGEALEAGHVAFLAAMEDALNKVIVDLPPFSRQISQQELDALTQEVENKVQDAIKDHMSLWQEIFDRVRWSASTLVQHTQDDLPPNVLDQLDINKVSAAGLAGAIGFTGAASQSRRAVGQGVLAHFDSGLRAVAGFADDTYQHALAATDDGNISEIWWQGSGGPGQGNLSHFTSPVVALAGFYSPDGFRHGIVATEDHQVTELWWQGPDPAGRGTLYTFGHSVVAVAGYHSGDGYQNVIVATDDGAISQLWWQGGGIVGQGNLTHVGGRVVGLGGYFATDAAHHVIVATDDGNLLHLTWQGPDPASVSLLAQVTSADWSRPVGAGAYDAPADGEQHAIVAMSDGMLREFHWSAAAPGDVFHDDLAGLAGLQAIGAYFDPSGYQHIIAATSDGDVHELWWAGATLAGPA